MPLNWFNMADIPPATISRLSIAVRNLKRQRRHPYDQETEKNARYQCTKNFVALTEKKIQRHDHLTGNVSLLISVSQTSQTVRICSVENTAKELENAGVKKVEQALKTFLPLNPANLLPYSFEKIRVSMFELQEACVRDIANRKAALPIFSGLHASISMLLKEERALLCHHCSQRSCTFTTYFPFQLLTQN
jgi:hypothetical protein